MIDWSDIRSFLSQPEVPGVAGALLSARDAPGATWGGRFFSVACGLCLAFFLLPYILEMASVKSVAGHTAWGFLGGFLGMNLLAKARDYIMTTSAGDLLKSLFPGKTP